MYLISNNIIFNKINKYNLYILIFKNRKYIKILNIHYYIKNSIINQFLSSYF